MLKRKLATRVLVLVGLLLSSIPAVGQTEVTLGGSVQSVIFTGNGMGGVTVNLGSCSKKMGNCTLSGSATGTGGLASGPATYTFMSAMNSVSLSLVDAASGLWSVTQASPITWDYGLGGSLLSGTLNLVDLVQRPSSRTGTFNDVANANLMITGGSLASVFIPSGRGILDVVVKFRCPTNLESLLGTNARFSGKVSSGEVLATPEPGSMLLFGSALLIMGIVFRRHRHSSEQPNV